MQNKSFEFIAGMAKPLNFRSKEHKDYIPRDLAQHNEVYRLCNIRESEVYPSLPWQLGEGTYFFIPRAFPTTYGAVVIRYREGTYKRLYEADFYMGLCEGCFKLRSPRDIKDRDLILRLALE